MGNDTFKYVEERANKYIELKHCLECGNPFYTDKYSEVDVCGRPCGKGKRGRPIGYRMSQESKDKIADSKTGQHHNKETIAKIKEATEKSARQPNKYRDHWYTHGGSLTPLWNKWICIKQRCNNPNNKSYKYYGVKGIQMCKEWLEDFTAFRDWCLDNGWKPGLHTHRKDPTKDYSPDNCEILTPSIHSQIHAIMRKQNERYIKSLSNLSKLYRG